MSGSQLGLSVSDSAVELSAQLSREMLERWTMRRISSPTGDSTQFLSGCDQVLEIKKRCIFEFIHTKYAKAEQGPIYTPTCLI